MITRRSKILIYKISVGVSYLFMILMNILANWIPIGGVNTGEVSDSYFNLFAPAGLTFSIWGLIYLMLAVSVLYLIGLIRLDLGDDHDLMIGRIGVIFSVTCFINGLWILAWHFRVIPVSMVLMVALLVCLIIINRTLGKEALVRQDKLYVGIPFSVYLGWITVAAIANMTILLVSLGWKNILIPDELWTIIILLVGLIIGMLVMMKKKDMVYGLVLIWAYAGILLRHVSGDGLAGGFPLVIFTLGFCLFVFLIGELILFIKYRKQRAS